MRAIVALFVCLLQTGSARAQQPVAVSGSFRIIVIEGEGAVNNIRQRTARAVTVQVEDANRKPVAGATVVFALPASGAGATFANGSKTLTVVTDAAGHATAAGLKPNQVAGVFQIRVSASFTGQTASAVISQVNTLAAGAGAGERRDLEILATARDFLRSGATRRQYAPGSIWPGTGEAKGYGLYSYVLLASPPTPASATKYRALVAAFLEMFADVRDYEGAVPRKQLNVTYVPIAQKRARRAGEAFADWVLANYDYPRATVLLDRAGLTAPGGPFLVSCLAPLSEAKERPGLVFLQDLSWVPATLMPLYVRQFEREVSKEPSWAGRALDHLALNLRTGIEILATEQQVALPALGTVIRLLHASNSR